jgi:hypothetical protein
MHLIEKIQDKLKASQLEEKYIRKVFKFPSVDYQDDPCQLLVEIEDYLVQHYDKIQDFDFESYIDSETMQTVLVLRMYPSKDISKHLQSNQNIDRIANCDARITIIRSGIKRIVESYLYEFNNERTRNEIQHRVSDFIRAQIEDFPEVKCIGKENSVGIFVLERNTYIPIDAYLNTQQKN